MTAPSGHSLVCWTFHSLLRCTLILALGGISFECLEKVRVDIEVSESCTLTATDAELELGYDRRKHSSLNHADKKLSQDRG